MTFANPAWLLLLLLAGVIAFLHARPRRDVEVGSLFLWRQLELAVPPRATRKLPVPNLLLFLQLLALLLIALALARPIRTDGQPPVDHWIVLLDASASMDAQVGGPSPFEEARSYVEGRMNAGRQPERLTLIGVASVPVVQAARLTRPESLIDALDAMQPTHMDADWGHVPAVLRGLTLAGERTRVTVLTDARGRLAAATVLEGAAAGAVFPPPAQAFDVGQAGAAGASGAPESPISPAFDLELIALGSPATNFALSTVEPTLLDEATGLWRIAGGIRRYGAPLPGDESVTVSILFEPGGVAVNPALMGAAAGIDDSAITPVDGAIPSGSSTDGSAGTTSGTAASGLLEWTNFTVPLDPGGIGSFDQTIALPGSGLLEIRLPGDALAHDNSHNFVLRQTPGTARVLYVGPGDVDLELALGAIPGVSVSRAPTLRGPATGYDLVLMDGVSGVGPTGTSTVWLGSAPDGGETGVLENPAASGWGDDHPLSRSVDWGSLGILSARALPLLPGAVSVLEALGGYPLVQARTTAAGREVVLAFRIEETDWPEQFGFPAFISNLLLWAVPDLGLSVEPPCRPGAFCSLGTTRLAADSRLLSPSGTDIALPRQPLISPDDPAAGVELAYDFGAAFVPSRAGVYRLVTENAVRAIAVNSSSGLEADLSTPATASQDDGTGEPIAAYALLPFHRWLLFLALVTLLAEVWIAGRRGERSLQLQALRSGNPLAPRRRAVLALRLGAVVLLLLAMLDPRTLVPTRSIEAVMVIDEASSTSEPGEPSNAFVGEAVGTAGRGRRIGTVRVGAEGQVTADLGSATAETPVRAAEPPAADLEASLRLAAALLPRETAGRIVVVGDGVETRGSVAAMLPELLSRGIPIDVHLQDAVSQDVAVEALSLPGPVHPNELAHLRTIVSASATTTVSLRLLREDALLSERIVELRPGRNRVDFEISEQSAGDFLYEVAVGPTAGDARPTNDRNGILVEVREPPRIAIVTPQPAWGRTFAEALAVQGLATEVFSPSRTPTFTSDGGPTLDDFDAIALMNVSAADLPDGRASEIETWVREAGGGLILMGGENTFGPGGYFDSPLEAVSPLSSKIPQELPNLAIVFVLDRSSSMGESAGQGTRLDITKLATLDAIELLDPETLVSVIAFDLSAYSVVPLQPAGNREAIREQVERLETGGGTWIYTGLALAFVELTRVDPEFRRHIVLMSDGRSRAANYPRLVELITDNGITLSTAAIGTGADVRLMEDLARRGGGAAHITTDFQELPSILAREATRFSSSAVREEAIEPTRVEGQVAGETSFGGGPPSLGGFVRTTAKPGAEVHIEAGEDTPLLASWRYGLGRVVAFASQGAGDWTADWMESPEYSAWWAQTVRWALPSARAGLNMQLSRNRDYGDILVEWVGAEPGAAGRLALEASVRAPDGTVQPGLPLAERSPGVYEGRFIADQPDRYTVTAGLIGPTGAGPEPTESHLYVGYAARQAASRPDSDLLRGLAAVTGGRVLSGGEELFDVGTPLRWIGRSLWPVWALLALGAFLLDLVGRYTSGLGLLARPWLAIRTRLAEGR